MTPSLEETVYLDFVTSSSTGAAADADSTPTAEVFEDATDTAILTPTVTKRTSKTGNYRVPVACTAANGFEAGKSYNVVASATIGGIAVKDVIGTFQMRTRDTDDLQPTGTAVTLPTAPTDWLNAAALATDAVQEIRNAITGGAYALSTDANGRIRIVDGTAAGELDTNAGTVTAGTVVDKIGFRLSATGVDDIWDEVQSGHTTTGTFGKYLDSAVSGVSTGGVSAAAIATAIWQDLLSGSDFSTVGSVGKLLKDDIDAAVSSRSTYAGGDTSGVTSLLGRLTALRAGYLDNLSGGATALELDLTTLLTRVGTPGTSIAGEIAALNDLSAAGVWASVTRTLTAGTNIALAKGVGLMGLNDLSAATVKTQVTDALGTDTYGEPAQGAPPATASLKDKLNWLYAAWRNKKDNDGATTKLYADDGTTVISKQTTASLAGVVSKSEWITGA